LGLDKCDSSDQFGANDDDFVPVAWASAEKSTSAPVRVMHISDFIFQPSLSKHPVLVFRIMAKRTGARDRPSPHFLECAMDFTPIGRQGSPVAGRTARPRNMAK
jgi:hypothetical protein